jgi:hypothetical protein
MADFGVLALTVEQRLNVNMVRFQTGVVNATGKVSVNTKNGKITVIYVAPAHFVCMEYDEEYVCSAVQR